MPDENQSPMTNWKIDKPVAVHPSSHELLTAIFVRLEAADPELKRLSCNIHFCATW
jgi:hypothetical protein